FGRVEADKIGDLLAKLLSINSFGEIGTNRSEDVSTMKGITYRLQIVVLRGDVAHMQPLLTRVDQCKHAIVRGDEVMPFAGHNNRPPGCSHSRINHNQVYRSVREVRVRLSNGERAIQHVES